jgi:hypothetical protein
VKSQVANFVLYQLGWLAVVFGVASGRPGTGSAAALALLGLHFWLADDRLTHFKLSVIAAALGFVVDTSLIAAGVYRFASGHPLPQLPPPWIILMWMQFAALLPYCLSWLRGRYRLAALLGLIGGPLAFLAGERIGAVTFLPSRLTHLTLLAIFWSGAMPTLVYATDRLFGTARGPCHYRSLTT